MSYIIAIRNPDRGGIIIVQDENYETAQYGTEYEAEFFCTENELCQAWGYQILEVE